MTLCRLFKASMMRALRESTVIYIPRINSNLQYSVINLNASMSCQRIDIGRLTKKENGELQKFTQIYINFHRLDLHRFRNVFFIHSISRTVFNDGGIKRKPSSSCSCSRRQGREIKNDEQFWAKQMVQKINCAFELQAF